MDVSGSGAVAVVGVEEAAAALEAGGLVAHPTSTVYGIGGRPGPTRDAEIARLKGRPVGQPLIRIAAEPEALRVLVPGVWPEAAERLAARFWPGPLTLIVPAEEAGEGGGVAVRVDPHPGLRALLGLAGGWMTSTSLNRHGDPPARDIEEARGALARMGPARLPLVLLDGGALAPSPPSTVVSCLGGRVEVLRAGAIGPEEIDRALGGAARNGVPDAGCGVSRSGEQR